ALAAARSAATARTGIVRHGLARHAGRRPAASARSRAAAAPAAEHLHLVANDLGGIALVALLVLPLAGAQAALNIDLRAFFQVFAGDLRQPAEEGHAVPLGALLLLAALLVAPALGGGDAKVRHAAARRHGARFRIRAQVADEDDFVDSARHECALLKRPPL